MKKIIFLLALFAAASFSVEAQTWEPVGTGMQDFGPPSVSNLTEDTINNLLYASGQFAAPPYSELGMASWNDVAWNYSICPNLYDPIVLSMYDGKLYISTISFNDSLFSLSSWDGTTLDSSGTSMYGTIVSTSINFNGKLIVGGHFYKAGNLFVNNIASWNGTTWDSLSSGTNGGIYTFGIYNGYLYIGGNFTEAGGVSANHIAKWNGNIWSAVGSGCDSSVYALAVYNGKLYAGGNFTQAGGITVNNIASWNGVKWDSLSSGIPVFIDSNSYYTIPPPSVCALTVYNGNLYVGGYFNKAGGISANNVATWNGTQWDSVGSGLNQVVYALTEFNGSLYAGGAFNIGSEQCMAQLVNPTGIPENNLSNNEVNIFPNPATNTLNVKINFEAKDVTYQIYNVTGQKISEGNFDAGETNNIDISQLPSGMYMLIVHNAEGQFAKKFVKE